MSWKHWLLGLGLTSTIGAGGWLLYQHDKTLHDINETTKETQESLNEFRDETNERLQGVDNRMGSLENRVSQTQPTRASDKADTYSIHFDNYNTYHLAMGAVRALEERDGSQYRPAQVIYRLWQMARMDPDGFQGTATSDEVRSFLARYDLDAEPHRGPHQRHFTFHSPEYTYDSEEDRQLMHQLIDEHAQLEGAPSTPLWHAYARDIVAHTANAPRNNDSVHLNNETIIRYRNFLLHNRGDNE